MNTSRTYTTAQLGTLIGAHPRNPSTPVLRLADRLGIARTRGLDRIQWPMPEALGILVAHRTAPGQGGQSHDVLAAKYVIDLVRRGYVPRWVLWCPVTGWWRASPLQLEALWPCVPREALDAGAVRVLSLTEVLADLEGVSHA